MPEFTHLDEHGAARMVDVGAKPVTPRMARASARVRMRPETIARIQAQQVAKGDVLATARVAGILAAKQTGQIIPLCHPLALDAVSVSFAFPESGVLAIEAEARVTARTGVEMEAMTAVSVAALTIYDMCKSLDRDLVIEAIRLEEKSGGRSGHFRRGAHAGPDAP